MGDMEMKKSITARLFREYDVEGKGELSPRQMQSLHEEIRLGGISLGQVKASMEYCCLMDDCCEPSELFDLLQEMDRRYFLVQDLRWEFALLDGEQKDLISEDQARFLFEVVHGNLFSQRRWEKFLNSRPVSGTGISFVEIEVDLCNIPSREAIALEQLEEQREQEERQRKYTEKKIAEELRRREFEAEKKRLQEEEIQKKKDEEERKKEEEGRLEKEREDEKRKQDEEEKGKKEALEREEVERREHEMEEKEAERLRELEIIEVQQALEAQRELERKAIALKEEERKEAEKDQNAEEEAIRAAELEKEAEEEARKAQEALKQAKNAEERRVAEEAEKAAKEKARREKHQRIRKELKVAIKKKDKDLITKSVKEFKSAKLADTDGDLKKAETILKRFKARDDLVKSMEIRTLESLEKAIDVVKKNGFEAYMPQEMAAANKMLLSLKRLKRLKDEILNLKQSTVAEIRSYSKPPAQVHKVMIATYILLGNKESELKDWKKMQALIGKTGKEGLKRRVMEADPNKIRHETATKVKGILSAFDLEQVRDVSAGAAIFFAWSSATEEDVLERERQRAEGITPTELKGGHKKIKTEMTSGSLTITI
ncbi:putative trichohyalin isoform X2 [Apostichopus japonicus]|uniref:Putative trichohyalin isoform X2 n=1 Tax=Stichopus japonicus TaxID=307972 RepID=A0A2G8LBA4_STIJA|nr:putative trichohyalin isoform X2 [Apostichopus japonicus]